MKISKIEKLPNINEFKNKEDFCNRLVQEILEISKNNPLTEKINIKSNELCFRINHLIEKNNNLDILIEKSNNMKTDLMNKISSLEENNKIYKERLLEILGD